MRIGDTLAETVVRSVLSCIYTVCCARSFTAISRARRCALKRYIF